MFAYAGPELVVVRVSAADHRQMTPVEARRFADELVEAAAHVERTTSRPMTGPEAIRAVTGTPKPRTE